MVSHARLAVLRRWPLAAALLVAVTVAAVIGLMAARSDDGTISTSDGTLSDGTAPCHFATTVPGGTLPQPQCPDQDASSDADVESTTDPDVAPFTCPDDDYYPIVQVSTSWQPMLSPPAALPSCQGDPWHAPPESEDLLLTPTEALDGVDGDLSVGVEVGRQPGGLIWYGATGIPATAQEDRLIWLRSYRSIRFEGDETATDVVTRRCAGAEVLVVRGVEGCLSEGELIWAEGETTYGLQKGSELEMAWPELIAWIDTWAAI